MRLRAYDGQCSNPVGEAMSLLRECGKPALAARRRSDCAQGGFATIMYASTSSIPQDQLSLEGIDYEHSGQVLGTAGGRAESIILRVGEKITA